MRTRRLAFFVLLSFLFLQLMVCAPHEPAEEHGADVLSVSSSHASHCHHETDSHNHEYLVAVPSRPDTSTAVPIVPVAAERSGRPQSAVQSLAEQPRSRPGRVVLLDLSIART